MKRWIVRTESYHPFTAWCLFKLPPRELARMVATLGPIEPMVHETRYRWHWLAWLRCLSDNAYNAFNPPWLVGLVKSTLVDSRAP